MNEENPVPAKPKRIRSGPRPKDRGLQIATMVGGGMTQLAIARELHITPSAVSLQVKKIASDPELQAARDEARRTIAPEALRILMKNLKRIDEALDGQTQIDKKGNAVVVMPNLGHMSSSLRELANVSGIARDEPTVTETRTSGGLQMSPESLARMLEAVRKHQQSLMAPRDVTPEGERIE